MNNCMHCCSTRLPGAAKRIPMKKKPIVESLQRAKRIIFNFFYDFFLCFYYDFFMILFMIFFCLFFMIFFA